MAQARILAVDDQRYFRELISGMLGEEGFEAQTASSAEEALQILEKADFDIVLTDLVMPGMDGTELVHRVKQRNPEQDIVVVTGVVDVKTAVDAMKLGATDYLLKPFDRRTLAVTLEGILQNRRLRTEHGRLLEENIEYIGERSLYQRSLGLFSTLAVEPLAARIVETLCLETRAQGGVLWVQGDGGPHVLDLAAARGLVRLADEPEAVELSGFPEALESSRTCLGTWGEDEARNSALYATIRRDGAVVGLARLTDKLEGEEFDAVDEACVATLVGFADVATSNALRFRELERRSLEDPATGAFNFEYFQNVVRSEIEKASRFGRSLALLRIDFDPAAFEHLENPAQVRRTLSALGDELGRLLRATDLLAIDGHRFYALLAEADALGAAVLKRRALATLSETEPFRDLDPSLRPKASIAIYPGDGGRLEALFGSLSQRIELDADSPVKRFGIERLSLSAGLQALMRHGDVHRAESAGQIARFVLSEIARRPRSRGLLFAAPGGALAAPLIEALASLRDTPTRTDVVMIAEGDRTGVAVPGVSWVAPERLPGLPPFLIHYGDGPAYALVREDSRDGAPARLYHTSDRALVEHLAFRLQEELDVPTALVAEAAP